MKLPAGVHKPPVIPLPGSKGCWRGHQDPVLHAKGGEEDEPIEMTSVTPQINCSVIVSSPWLPWDEELAFCPSRLFVDGIPMLTRTDHLGCVFLIGARGQNAPLLEPIGSSPVSLTWLIATCCSCRWGEESGCSGCLGLYPSLATPLLCDLGQITQPLWALVPLSVNWRCYQCLVHRAF